ncbi:MAG TPA: DUF2087 domain-containing protein [Streptosporangiaceae bacterium]|nr:DUF2087 domain-containing protein [Streptosporangiaceae bacterium]
MSSDDAVLRTFMPDGQITAMPAKRSKRLVLLDHVAQRFEIGVRYSESDVNRTLRTVYEDYAALRRYLVDEGLMSRKHNEYWRSGGTVDVDEDAANPPRSLARRDIDQASRSQSRR